jgi:S1-C subfamily serine protease
MFKTFLVVAGLLFASMTASYAVDKAELPKQQEQMFSPLVQLNGNCSGSLIYSNRDEKTGEVTSYILTAKHCVASMEQIHDVKFPDYTGLVENRFTVYKATTKGMYWKADLALLQLKDKTTFFEKTVKLAPRDVELVFGEDVWTVGYPFGLGRIVTEGLLNNYEVMDSPKTGTEYLRATPDIGPGNSGGAMFHKDKDGNYEQIGVTTAMLRGFPFSGFYTSIKDIHDALKVMAPEVVGVELKKYTPASK